MSRRNRNGFKGFPGQLIYKKPDPLIGQIAKAKDIQGLSYSTEILEGEYHPIEKDVLEIVDKEIKELYDFIDSYLHSIGVNTDHLLINNYLSKFRDPHNAEVATLLLKQMHNKYWHKKWMLEHSPNFKLNEHIGFSKYRFFYTEDDIFEDIIDDMQLAKGKALQLHDFKVIPKGAMHLLKEYDRRHIDYLQLDVKKEIIKPEEIKNEKSDILPAESIIQTPESPSCYRSGSIQGRY